jgi:hypothetical protein
VSITLLVAEGLCWTLFPLLWQESSRVLSFAHLPYRPPVPGVQVARRCDTYRLDSERCFFISDKPESAFGSILESLLSELNDRYHIVRVLSEAFSLLPGINPQ